MFKKIEIWILYIVVLILILTGILFGFLVKYNHKFTGNILHVSNIAMSIAEVPILPVRVFRTLSGLPNVEDKMPDIYGFHGNTHKNQSYLILSRYNGDIKQGVVELIDLKTFQILHTWNPDFNLINDNENLYEKDEFNAIGQDRSDNRALLKHPVFLNDGSLIFNYITSPLTKIDKCSKVIYQNTDDAFHHSVEIDDEGNIWAPTHMHPSSMNTNIFGSAPPGSTDNPAYLDDAIVKVSPEGKKIFEKSVSQIFIENNMEYLLNAVGDRSFTKDPIHLNDIQPVLEDGPYWKKGDVFLSLRHQSMIILYRPSSNEILWKSTGRYFHQHDVNIINDHQISVFNNNSKDGVSGDFVDGFNEVIIYDFEKDSYSKYLPKSLENYDVATITQGRGKITDKGDLFIEESNYGRLLYFKSDGSLKWVYNNKAQNKKVYDVSWSRILFKNNDIIKVNQFLKHKNKCYE